MLRYDGSREASIYAGQMLTVMTRAYSQGQDTYIITTQVMIPRVQDDDIQYKVPTDDFERRDEIIKEIELSEL